MYLHKAWHAKILMFSFRYLSFTISISCCCVMLYATFLHFKSLPSFLNSCISCNDGDNDDDSVRFPFNFPLFILHVLVTTHGKLKENYWVMHWLCALCIYCKTERKYFLFSYLFLQAPHYFIRRSSIFLIASVNLVLSFNLSTEKVKRTLHM